MRWRCLLCLVILRRGEWDGVWAWWGWKVVGFPCNQNRKAGRFPYSVWFLSGGEQAGDEGFRVGRFQDGTTDDDVAAAGSEGFLWGGDAGLIIGG